MRDGAKHGAIDLRGPVTSGIFHQYYWSGIMGYGCTAEAKIWQRSLRHDAACEGGDFFEVADQKGMNSDLFFHIQ